MGKRSSTMRGAHAESAKRNEHAEAEAVEVLPCNIPQGSHKGRKTQKGAPTTTEAELT